MNIVKLPTAKIFTRLDARKVDDGTVTRLINSILEVGIINPLRVRPARKFVQGVEADAYEVTAGNHRLRAAMNLGLETVPCIVVEDDDLHAELAMIDENLMRAELNPAQRVKQTARRKAIYLELHPETAAHVAGAHASNRAQGNASANLAPAFTADTAASTGKSERAVQRDAERGEKIAPEVLDKIASAKHLNTGAYLDQIKKLAPDKQAAKVERDLVWPKSKPIAAARQKPRKSKSIIGPIKLCSITVRRIVFEAAHELESPHWPDLLAELRDEIDDIEKVLQKRSSEASKAEGAAS